MFTELDKRLLLYSVINCQDVWKLSKAWRRVWMVPVLLGKKERSTE